MTSNNKNNKRSTSTMRYLTMVVALVPSVAAFSEVVHRTPLKATRSSTAATRSSICPKTQRSMTRLFYISGADPQQHQHQGAAGPTWFNAIFGREQSSAADEYLEFLDRRYNRILKDSDQEAEKAGFNVMKWLHSSSSPASTETATSREEDALYALGVAGLASKKFLQKHHMQSPEENKQMVTGTVVTAEIVDDTSSAPVRLITAVLKRRELLLQKQSRGIRFAMACAIHQVLTGPARAIEGLKKLYALGGGKKSLAWTVAAMAACAILLRPLIRVAAAEGANTMRP